MEGEGRLKSQEAECVYLVVVVVWQMLQVSRGACPAEYVSFSLCFSLVISMGIPCLSGLMILLASY